MLRSQGRRLRTPLIGGLVSASVCGGVAALAVQGPPSEEAPRDIVPIATLLDPAPTATLISGDLRVTVALPDARRGFYRSTRFDWSGIITEATLGKAGFYGPWVDGVAPNIRDYVDTPDGVIAGPRNSATGPAEEFANRDGETVPGYNAAPAGGTFIKIGVGRLRKTDAKPYDHFLPYTIVDGGKWTVRRSASHIAFTQRIAADAGGYGYDYEKTLTLSPGGVMTIAHRLRNIGTRPINTQVYNHNFARFDGAEAGPGVTVEFPFTPVGAVSNPSIATLEGNVVRYLRAMTAGERLQLPQQLGAPGKLAGPFRVTGANGASITMEADVPLVRTVLWSMRRTVAVEPFVAINIEPGKEQRWSWRYTFSAAK